MTSPAGMVHYEHEFQPDTRPPQPPLPEGAGDCQIHVFGYPPFHATFDVAQKMHASLGIARAVLVQPAAYGTDFRLLLACLAKNPSYRATALIDDRVSAAQLHELHAAGVRGIRAAHRGCHENSACRDHKMPRSESSTVLHLADIQPLIDGAAKYKLIPAPFSARDMLWNGISAR